MIRPLSLRAVHLWISQDSHPTDDTQISGIAVQQVNRFMGGTLPLGDWWMVGVDPLYMLHHHHHLSWKYKIWLPSSHVGLGYITFMWSCHIRANFELDLIFSCSPFSGANDPWGLKCVVTLLELLCNYNQVDCDPTLAGIQYCPSTLHNYAIPWAICLCLAQSLYMRHINFTNDSVISPFAFCRLSTLPPYACINGLLLLNFLMREK